MSRYTGPRAALRRLGTNIWGTKGETIALDKRPYPPGEHGRSRGAARSPNTSCSCRRSRRPASATASPNGSSVTSLPRPRAGRA